MLNYVKTLKTCSGEKGSGTSNWKIGDWIFKKEGLNEEELNELAGKFPIQGCLALHAY